MTDYITVAKVGEIPDQEGRAFKVDDTMVAVFNDGGVYRAIDDMCPHAGASLAAGFYDNKSVTCPWHAWRFNVCDGTFLDSPRLRIDVYEVRVEDDEIQVSRRPKLKNPASASENESARKADLDNDGEPFTANPNG